MFIRLLAISLLYVSIETSSLKNGKPHYNIESADALFADFVKNHNKTYDSDEYAMRFEIFTKTLEKVNNKNIKHEHTVFGINKFSDWTREEKSSLFGSRPDQVHRPSTPISFEEMLPAPESLDWRKKNVVTPVKNQGFCGSCWAFSAVAAIESQYAMKYKKYIDLAEQQPLDCDYNDAGCDGGMPIHAFEYFIDAGGVMKEDDYQYIATDFNTNDCASKADKMVVKVKNATSYEHQLTEDQMAQLLANKGPLAIAMFVGQEILDYWSGVFVPDDCVPKKIDHAVLIVGYGTENDVPYWIIKNSWAEDWGDHGYFKMIRGKGLCSINEYVAVVEIE